MHAALTEPAAARAEEEGRVRLRRVRELRPADAHPVEHRIERRPPERHDPLLGALAEHAGGLRLQVDVVGLDVSGDARDQLKCVASRGRGTYYDARNSETLASSL